jgi:DNA polymerase-3 subunit epsilon
VKEGRNLDRILRLYKQGGVSPAVLSFFQPQRAEQIAWVRSMLRDAYKVEKDSQKLSDVKTLVIDLETTGFNAYHGDEIISIGAVRMTGMEREADGGFYSLVDPNRLIPDQITELTGIDNEMVQEAPSMLEVLPRLMSYIENRILIAHFSKHDQTFLQQALWKTCKTAWTYRMIDTAWVARQLYPGLNSYALEDLLSFIGIQIKTRHHALSDAEMAGELWSFFIKEAISRNLTTMYELLNAN